MKITDVSITLFSWDDIPETNYNNVANLHVMMAIPNSQFFEVFLPDSAQKYGLIQDIAVDTAGQVHAPTGPGLGAAIDFELIKRKTVAVLR
jgi:L-alanine-DL-glutamate epimerase-like enolase superfamily enzyme